jgi:ERCC4-type nuclease
MKLICDERETMVYQFLTELIKSPITLEKRMLELGDFVLASDDETVKHLVFERKTYTDLLASIKDGRYAEQSHRLINCFPNPHNIVYLLEGAMPSIEADKKKVYSCIASLNYFKGFSVMRTLSMGETAQLLANMSEKIARELANNQGSNNPGPEPYCSVVKSSKKANISRENIGEIILCQIPGISSVTAVALMKPFASFADFLDKVRADPAYLEGISIQNNGKTRKLGSNVVSGIKQFLC